MLSCDGHLADDRLPFAWTLFSLALKAVNGEKLVRENVIFDNNALTITCPLTNVSERIDLSGIANIYTIATGKAASYMAKGLWTVLGDRLTKGIIITKDNHSINVGNCFDTYEVGHPIPDERGVSATRKVIELALQAGPNDLVIGLVSGGTSAMLVAPRPGVTLEDKKTITKLLLDTSADIVELNTIRQCLSEVKGGQLARKIHPARCVALIISDVIGDPPGFIGSGPFHLESVNYNTLSPLDIINKYNLRHKIHKKALDVIESASEPTINKNCKDDNLIQYRAGEYILANNRLALEAIAMYCHSLMIPVKILPDTIKGEARNAAIHLVKQIKELIKKEKIHPPHVFLSGGETTVTIKGNGLGGRNQDFALAAALALQDEPEFLLLSVGTDGTDGPTEYAGAWVNAQTAGQADAYKYLENNDSCSFFKHVGGLIKTGPTGTNVMDIQILIWGNQFF